MPILMNDFIFQSFHVNVASTVVIIVYLLFDIYISLFETYIVIILLVFIYLVTNFNKIGH